MKVKNRLTMYACIATAATGMFAANACAALALNIDILTPDEFKFTISGSFDSDAIGDQKNWLAIKYDWTNNFGMSTAWLDDSLGFQEVDTAPWTIVENTITINGVAPSGFVESVGNPWGDSIYFNAGFDLLAGMTVSGSFHVAGVGLFDDSIDITKLELLSGFDDAALDWVRLEAGSVPAPGAVALLGLAGLVGVRRRRS